jgi:hypothetical protein
VIDEDVQRNPADAKAAWPIRNQPDTFIPFHFLANNSRDRAPSPVSVVVEGRYLPEAISVGSIGFLSAARV